jgi:hypothetical protein
MRSTFKFCLVSATLLASIVPSAQFGATPAAATGRVKVVIQTKAGMGVLSQVAYVRGNSKAVASPSDTLGNWYLDARVPCDAETRFQVTQISSGYLRPNELLPCTGDRRFIVEAMKQRRS